MTREEAIKRIEYIAHDFFINDKGCEALDMAIKALEQEPCDDCVNRAELLKALDTWDKFGVDDTGHLFCLDNLSYPHYEPYIHYRDVIKAVKDMSSVQPKITTQIDKSNFNKEQYNVDLQCAYDCGKASVQSKRDKGEE